MVNWMQLPHTLLWHAVNEQDIENFSKYKVEEDNVLFLLVNK